MNDQTPLVRAFAAKLKDARERPPTFSTVFWRWRNGLGLLVFGLAGTAVLAYLAHGEGSALSRDWPIANAAIFLGAIFRDVGIALRAVRLWPAQEGFIDWSKVDEALARQP